MSFTAEITTSGALVDGTGRQTVDRGLQNMMETLGIEAERRVHRRLGIVLRNPTGRYRSRIATTVTPTYVEVHDSGVIYGPWLEGVSSRNTSTRFKGYSTFRKIAQQVNADAGVIVTSDLNRLAARLGS